MDIWALAGAIKYGPKNATMTKNAKVILTDLWKDIADHYNPYLARMAGPVRLPAIHPVSLSLLNIVYLTVRPCLYS